MTRSAGIRAVLFDAGNTLIYLDPARMADLIRRTGVPATASAVARAELRARRLLHDAVREGHAGTEPEVWRNYFRALFREAGVDEGRAAEAARLLREEHAQRHLWTHVAPGTGRALTRLRDAGYRLGVISNADGRVAGVLEEVGLAPFFEFVLDSQVVGVEKPDPEIFRRGCARMDLEAAACLYVGDLYPVDYLGATRAGMEAVLLDPLGVHPPGTPVVASLAELAGRLGSPPPHA